MIQSPMISVIMPAYNSALYIRQAVESILRQTFTDFELLIYDDCSTDKTIEIIESFTDERIILFKKQTNTGYANSLQQAVTDARGKYIARMDSDDISLPHRLQTQFDFMEANPGYGIAGSQVRAFDEENRSQLWVYPSTDEEIRIYTIVFSPFAHPAVMIRKAVLDQYHLNYKPAYEPCEDYKLWVDMLAVTKGANLNEVLLEYRLHEGQTINIKRDTLLAKADIIRREVMRHLFGVELTKEELELHYYFFNETGSSQRFTIQQKYVWKQRLLGWFGKTDLTAAGTFIEKYWLLNLSTVSEFRPALIKHISSGFLKSMSFPAAARFFIKCLIGYKATKA